jgi:hypothetical protein
MTSSIAAMEINREELAWAAGFLDGEGSVGLHERRRPGKRLTFQAAQVSPVPLRRLQAALGGRIHGPYGPYQSNHQPYYLWFLDGFERVQAAVAMVWPFLSSPKRDQATRVLREWNRNHDARRAYWRCGHPRTFETTYTTPSSGIERCHLCKKAR